MNNDVVRIDNDEYQGATLFIKVLSENNLEKYNPAFSMDIWMKQFDIIAQKYMLYKYSLDGKLRADDIRYIRGVVINDSLLDFYNQYMGFEEDKYITWEKIAKLKGNALKFIVDEICESTLPIEDEFIFYCSLCQAEFDHPLTNYDTVPYQLIIFLATISENRDSSPIKHREAIVYKFSSEIIMRMSAYITIFMKKGAKGDEY